MSSSSALSSSSDAGTSSSSSVSSSGTETGEYSSSSELSSSSGAETENTSSSSSSDGSSSSGDGGSSSSSVASSSSALKECEALYDPSLAFCYDGKVYYKCGNIVYNPTIYICEGISAIPAKCNDVPYNPLIQRCQNYVIETECGTKWYNAINQICSSGDVIKTQCGSGWYDASIERCCNIAIYNPETHFCYNNNEVSNFCGNRKQEYDPSLYKCGTENPNGIYLIDGITDTRDGDKHYNAVLIGAQVWMVENLNYDVLGNDTDICYQNDQANCNKYGRLYNWMAATSGICPDGWHIPNNDEWATLANFVGGFSTAGTKLKATSDWKPFNGSYDVPQGTDEFGFYALPGGANTSPGENGFWWSANNGAAGTSDAYFMRMRYDSQYFGSTQTSNKNSLYSVRCVKD